MAHFIRIAATAATAAATALALGVATAQADSLTLPAEMAGGTLGHAGVDMSVFWVAQPGGYAVTARYVTPTAVEGEAQLRMLLQDGDVVSFGLPGVGGQHYSFAAQGGAITVTATRSWMQLASN